MSGLLRQQKYSSEKSLERRPGSAGIHACFPRSVGHRRKQAGMDACAPRAALPEASLVRSDFNVIKIEFICAVGEDPRAALTISHRIGPFDQPVCGFRFARGPCLAARAGLAAGQVLDLQLHAVPGVGLPREWLAESARRLDLP